MPFSKWHWGTQVLHFPVWPCIRCRSWSHLIWIHELQGNCRQQTLLQCHILTNSTKHCSCLTSKCYHHLANSFKHIVLLDCPLAPWYENMMSFVKHEVHNILQCHQKRTEPLPQAALKNKKLCRCRGTMRCTWKGNRGMTIKDTHGHYSCCY